MKNMLTSLPLLLASTLACAHEGHGQSGTQHGHASDAWGFVMLAVLAGAALWWRGRK